MKKNVFVFKIFLLVSSLSSLSMLWAVPAYNKPFDVIQPDGRTLTVRLHGDEFFSYYTTSDSFLLVEDSDGYMNYAEVNPDGRIISLDVRAHNRPERASYESEFLVALQPVNELYIATNTKKNRPKSVMQKAPSATSAQQSYPLTGSPRSLVILVSFKDKSFQVSNPLESFSNLLNEPEYSANGGTGSAKDYFKDNSFGKFSPQFDVVGPFNLPDSVHFYGRNTGDSNDENPRKMIIDACRLASENGVNFANYDTDNDGLVDNVFVFYAGYNEAEGGGSNTVWPHRWVLANYNTRFNGKIISDYACTSELRGRNGINMAGIGTFVHEFGHVLGLPDLYATNNSEHHTLSEWDVMDGGAYNNRGRTPPAYSSYQRFSLDWLKPTELKESQDVVLNLLNSSGQAFIVTKDGNHNHNGKSPSPAEFFMLENRQQEGWDTYLPGHGMLITRVHYNHSDWWYNQVNNNPAAMGVDIMEADGLATVNSTGGDPFPGLSAVISFNPVLRDGTVINKPVTEITETGRNITFKFMGGKFTVDSAPVGVTATNITPVSFTARWEPVLNAQKYLLDVYTISHKDTIYLPGFQLKDVGLIQDISIEGLQESTLYYYRLKAVNENIISKYSHAIAVQTNTYTFDMFKPVATEATDITATSFVANWTWDTNLFTPESYQITVFAKDIGTDLEISKVGFDNSVLPDGWTGNNSYLSTSGFYGQSAPSAHFTSSGSYVQTPLLDNNIAYLKFWYKNRSTNSNNALEIHSSINGTDWNLVKSIDSISNVRGTTDSLSFSGLDEVKMIKFVYSQSGLGNIVLDDVTIGSYTVSDVIIPEYDKKDVGNNREVKIEGLDSSRDYYYQVTGLNNNITTDVSNVIKVKTQTTSIRNIQASNIFKLVRHADALELKSLTNNIHPVQLFNVNGQKIFEGTFDSTMIIPMKQRGIYLLRIDNNSTKLVW